MSLVMNADFERYILSEILTKSLCQYASNRGVEYLNFTFTFVSNKACFEI